MTTLTFDTLAFAKKLKSAGFTEQQAEVQASAMAEVLESQVASKQDIKTLETFLTYELRQLEMRLTLRLGAVIVTAVGLFATIIKFF